uniref:Uncharacterized protein n=1 Tax=Chaetoceros debilis TaxID=122233 RepID=A0A7S3PW96_9STRA
MTIIVKYNYSWAITLFLCAVRIGTINSWTASTHGHLLQARRQNKKLMPSLDTRRISHRMSRLQVKNNNERAIQNAKLQAKDTSDEWILEEDWMLQDQVPQFTISSSSRIFRLCGGTSSDTVKSTEEKSLHRVTFWTQLRHSSPLLSQKTEDQLEKRYRVLYNQNWHDVNDVQNNFMTKGKQRMIIPCGSSPELLTDWCIVDTPSTDVGANTGTGKRTEVTMMMGGKLMNGSNIWFPLNQCGTLAGHQFLQLDHHHKSLHRDEVLDYAESMGGNIYELGMPVSPSTSAQIAPGSNNIYHEHIRSTSTHEAHPASSWRSKWNRANDAALRERSASSLQNANRSNHPEQHAPLVSAQNANIVSIITASVISAVIAFSSYPLHSQLVAQSTVSAQPGATVIVQAQTLEAPPLPPPSIKYRESDGNELSISAQRARQELRVERDRITIMKIEERMKMDENKLKELKKEENRLEAIKYGYL